MGLNPGRKPRKVVDMAVEPAKFQYVPTEESIETIWDISLGACDLYVREARLGGLIVDYALNQRWATHDEVADGIQLDVARIDCCHSEVHRHQFYKAGQEDPKYEVLVSLKGCASDAEAQDMVNASYQESYDRMINNWEDYLERWERGA